MDILSAQEVVSAIDRAGNQDGSATLQDIQPYLDSNQQVVLGSSQNPKESTIELHRALATLNRICGQPRDLFRMPSVLRCSIIQDGKIDTKNLAMAESAFVKAWFEKAFNNKNSDDIVRAHYKEFLSFVEANHIPLPELFNVLINANDFTEPLENVVSKGLFFSDDQKRCLLQLSLYAALWHLKYNVKAFSPEELAKYPEWFRRKVEGFEDFMLPLLKDAKMDVVIGNPKALGFVYDYKNDVILSPSKNPLPPFSLVFLETAWHELFHYYGDRKSVMKPVWMEERDAELIAACATLKMLGITTTKDERFAELYIAT